MDFDNITFHGINEIIFNKDYSDYSLLRAPKVVEDSLSEQGKAMNRSTTGVELRFYMESDEVKLILKGIDSVTRCFVYFGDVQGEWFQSHFDILPNKESEILLKKTMNLDALEDMNKAKNSLYPSSLVRIVFDGNGFKYVKKIGETKPYINNNKVLLAYGSSITSNSIVPIPSLCYISRLAKYLKADLFNCGYPGSCEITKEYVDYLATLKFDICHLELGINVVASIELDEFERRCRYLFNTLLPAHKDAKYYLTDIFSHYNERCNTSDEKLASFRKVIEDLYLEYKNQYNITYIKGKDLFPNRYNLCLDLVHPDVDGHEEIFNNYLRLINEK